MAKLKIYSEITDKDTKTLYSWLDKDAVCFDDINDFISSIPEDDANIDLYIHCPGGSCVEGFAMYDALRTSGKTITTIVEGMAASMATILMMAAPKERRLAQKNASICIHKPFYSDYSQYARQAHIEELEAMANKMRIQADELRDIENKILDIYVERTGTDRDTLISLMEDNRFITMDKALDLGIIGSILEPNTDFKTITKMNKVAVEAGIFAKMLKALGISKVEDFKSKDMVVTSADGSELTIDREDGNPEVGDVASPDGEFVMADGSTIVVADGKISDIRQKTEEEEEEEDDDDEDKDDKNRKCEALEIEKLDLVNKLTSITAERDSLVAGTTRYEELVLDLKQQITDLKQQITDISAERDALNVSQKNDNEIAILDKINSLGGMDWLDMAEKAASGFVPEKGGFNSHNGDSQISFDSFLEDKAKSRRYSF